AELSRRLDQSLGVVSRILRTAVPARFGAVRGRAARKREGELDRGAPARRTSALHDPFAAGALRQDGSVYDAGGRGPVCARTAALARRHVGGSALDAAAKIFLSAWVSRRISRRADRLDLRPLRLAEVPQAGRAG